MRSVTVLVALVLTYENAALLINRALHAANVQFHLPLGSWLGGLFNVFPVFTHYETLRYVTCLEGLPSKAEDREDAWLRLSADDYFPFRLGEQRARMEAAGHFYLDGQRGQRQVWDSLLRKVLDRYHLDSTATRLRAVRLCREAWSNDGRLVSKDITWRIED